MNQRAVVQTTRFELELLAFEPDVARSDEFLEGVEWVLSRDPELGLRLSDEVWALDTSEYALIKPMTVFYTFDEQTVWLLSIQTNPYMEDLAD